MPKLTINQLAKAAGVPTTTIRYYERIGLLLPAGRSSSNYRLYDDASLERLKFIRAAQSIGFTLDDVRQLVGEHGEVPCCGDVQHLIEDRLAEIAAKMKELRHVQRVLKASLAKCRESNPRKRCHVLESLNG